LPHKINTKIIASSHGFVSKMHKSAYTIGLLFGPAARDYINAFSSGGLLLALIRAFLAHHCLSIERKCY